MKLFVRFISMIIFMSCQKNKHQTWGVPMSNATVIEVYPKQNILPENILKFYIKFSKPMREGNFLEHIKLYNGKGENISGVFFDNIYELWNNNHTQITLLVDPGRVKTGLQQNIKLGRAFTANENYTLSIDTTWRTIQGSYLSKPFIKKFSIKEEDVTQPTLDAIYISKAKKDSKKTSQLFLMKF